MPEVNSKKMQTSSKYSKMPKTGAPASDRQSSTEASPEDDSKAATLASVTYSRIRRDIIVGRLRPGTKLRMTEVCTRYGIGLSPLREALSRLGTEGLVQQADRRGFAVTGVGAAELRELIHTRAMLYEVALRESIRKGSHDWEEAILVSFHRLQRSGRNGHAPGSDEWDELHRRFHTALIAACGSRYLITSCELLFDQAERYRNLSRKAVVNRNIDSEHKAIMDATIARDEEKATALLLKHVQRTGALAMNSLK